MEELFKKYKREIRHLLRYGILKVEELDNPSVFNGKLGIAIIFYEYSRYSKDKLYEEFANEIIDYIFELPNTLPLSFSNGLTGIAWGITYLLKENFIEGDINDILSEIDTKLSYINTNHNTYIKDYSYYIKIRNNYTNDKIEIEKRLPQFTYNEKNVLEQIWTNCLF